MFNLDGQVVYSCEGCERNNNGTCTVWLSPEAKFHGRSDCGMATHITKRTKVTEEKKRVGQQKQKKN